MPLLLPLFALLACATRAETPLCADPAAALKSAPAIAPGADPASGYWLQRGAWVPCGEERLRAVASEDGAVEVWTGAFETLPEWGEERPEVQRGQGWIRWRGPDGAWRVVADPGELHLDAIIDQIVPLGEGKVLLLGLRAYRTKYPGELPRRFAEVLALGEGGASLVQSAFVVGESPSDVLLLAADPPPTGKFRHHLFASQGLSAEGTPPVIGWGALGARGGTTLARWEGGVFVVDPGAVAGVPGLRLVGAWGVWPAEGE